MSATQPVSTQSRKVRIPKQKASVPAVDFETPYMLTDLRVPQDNVAKFKRLLPQVAIYYAVKANNDQKLIRMIDQNVQGYDVASLGEIEYLLTLGITADRLMYSNPVKIPSHIEGAYKLGVRYFAFDSSVEIEKIAQYAPGSNVYLRMRVSDYGSKFPLSRKFGVDPLHAVDYCSVATDAGLHVKGVTFHVGSQSENLQVWEHALKVSGEVIERLQEKGMDIEFLDIGGGFPADYGDPVPGLNEIAAAIKASVKAHIPAGIKLIAEPGRYVVANSSTMVASVIGCENRSGTDWLYLDVGAFQGLIEPLEMPNLRYPIKTDKGSRGYRKTFVLSGPTCDACDTIGSDYLLPSDLKVGDRIYIGAVGAYSLVYASNFNGFKIPDVHYVNEEA